MGTISPEIAHDVPPYIRVYIDGTVERLVGTEFVPASFDPETGVDSKDVKIDSGTGIFARIYRPAKAEKKILPLVVYFHGGAFCISSVGDPFYHRFLNVLVSKTDIILVSINYRLAPEHPLPAAYDDSWTALEWISKRSEDWLREYVDWNRVFIAGDSAGANISHHVSIRANKTDLASNTKLEGIIMIHPYFWGEKPIGIEAEDPVRKSMVDKWWGFVCPSDNGNEDSWINPFVDGIECLEDLSCDRVILFVAGKDILRDRGKLYYDSLVKSQWSGKAEIVVTEEEDHVFHIFDPYCEHAVQLVKRLDVFINKK